MDIGMSGYVFAYTIIVVSTKRVETSTTGVLRISSRVKDKSMGMGRGGKGNECVVLSEGEGDISRLVCLRDVRC
jgi:hypothetical protein